jgi:two-component system phosphate regulon sensor histidine kinase PhoR
MSSSQLASGKLEDKPESRQKYYQICSDQSSKLLATVERLLLVAKAEHSAIIPNIEDVDTKSFIEKIAENFRMNNFRQKNLEILTLLPKEELIGKFDPVLIENVLSNLIDNAIKYSDSSVKIEIICGLSEGKLRLNIKDNGFGISEKELKHIFNNFERGNKVENKGIDGFGIGLNYVQKVIKAHNGNIKVESKEGKGSEFIIELPN